LKLAALRHRLLTMSHTGSTQGGLAYFWAYRNGTLAWADDGGQATGERVDSAPGWLYGRVSRPPPRRTSADGTTQLASRGWSWLHPATPSRNVTIASGVNPINICHSGSFEAEEVHPTCMLAGDDARSIARHCAAIDDSFAAKVCHRAAFLTSQMFDTTGP